MQKKLLRLCSLVLTIAMLCNMLPLTTLAASAESQNESTTPLQAASEAHIVAELPEERTAYTKTFRLSNGLNMAAVYNDPVHYEKDGKWAEIDNTLKLSGTDTNAVLTNTAGLWDVQFPQQLSGSKAVSVTKDGYTLSFFMAGQLRDNGNVLQTAPMGSAQAETFALGSEVFGVQAVSSSAARIEETDTAAKKNEAKYPETVLEKNHSRLAYSGVYANTDLVYDLTSNRVKESIVIGVYDASLRGYRYTLNVGDLVPVLTDANEILLYDESRENVVLSMPAPYLEDAKGGYSDDIAVSLTGSGDTWTLVYTLPRSWMAAEDRVYPVVLDPVVETPATPSNIQDVSIYQRNAQPYTSAALDVGRHTTYGLMRTYIQFNTLPELSPGDVVVDASLSLYFLSNSGSAVPICVHGVLHDWDEDSFVWDPNDPDWDEEHPYDPNVTDYNSLQYKGTYEWDVTEIVRYWYDVANYGLMLKLPDSWEADTNGNNIRHQFGAKNYSVYDLPTVTVIYRSVIGIEPYYTYNTLSAGNAGGVYISDSTGHMTAVRPAGSYASTVNPFSMNLVYNSIHFAENPATEYYPLEEMGLSMRIGSGWRLDAIQKVEPLNDNYLKYLDGDGTVHYFKKSGSTYYDEDGLGLQITAKSDGTYTMKDDMDNEWSFTYAVSGNTGRFLTSTVDNNGNGYELTYTSGKLTTIQQKNSGHAGITVASFTYDGDYLDTITDAASKTLKLTYASGKLTDIAYNGTTLAQYTYSGHRLTVLKDAERNYTLQLDYYTEDSETDGKKKGLVSHYKEIGYDAVEKKNVDGVQRYIYYYGTTQTVYHDYGYDGKTGVDINDNDWNGDDLYTYYMCDFWGRTVNVYTTDGYQKEILGASTALHTDNKGIDKTNNRTERTASIGVAAQKLLTQGGFESTSDLWTHSGTSASQTKPRTGLYSLKATTTSSSATVQASKTSLALAKDKVYTLSGYVNTSALTSISGTGVSLKLTESNGTAHTSEAVKNITSTSIDKGWVRIAVSFTAESSGTATVSIQGTGVVGTFYVDDVQLEQAEAPSNYNMLENGDFQVGSSGAGWTLREKASLCTGVGVGLAKTATDSSAKSLKFTNTIQEEQANAYQSVRINKTGAQSYVISGWAMADAVPDTLTVRYDSAVDHQKQFGIRAVVNYSDGEQEYFYVPFNADLTGWQYASLTVVPKYTSKAVSYITVYCVYETNANSAWFDNISVVEEAVNVYKYDANGNPTSSSTTGLNGQTVTYDSNGNVKTVVQKTGTGSSDKITTTYTYHSSFKHRVVSVDNGFTTQTMGYDDFGNVTSTTLSKKNETGGKVITSASDYSNDGNQLESVTDSAGNVTSYSYASNLYKMLGQPYMTTNAKGNYDVYSLDARNRVSNITFANLAVLGYNYSGGMLSSIRRSSISNSNWVQTYNFSYDGFGNTTGIYIGTGAGKVTLAEYAYGSKNGMLQSQTYGNDDKVVFEYDDLGRVKTASYYEAENASIVSRKLTYTYTGDGQLYSVADSKTKLTYQYSYDSQGRLMSSSVTDVSDPNNPVKVITTRQTYDTNNQLSAQYWQLGSTQYSETYTYSKTTGLLATHKPAVGNTLTYGYDTLQRLSTVTGGIYGKTYTYRNTTGNNTTTQVSQLKYSLPTELLYGYTYDNLGNIATYTEGGTTYTYTYDAQNQLTKQTGGGKTYTYSYDVAGNILSASNGTTSHTYAYENTTWRDLLTKFDGQSITYDNAGNPTSYYNGARWTMTWAEGRRLATASKSGTSLSFTYDSDGLRLSKNVNGTVHNYSYAGNKLMRETWGSNTLDFFYDSAGTPYALKYNGTLYYYITNLQGDVLKIVNTSGTPVVSYSYDPYGKPTVTSDTSNVSLGTVNPLRYRGYVYDTESGLYYLQARYYDPTTCRFINADTYVSTGQGIIGCNMFAYCKNNPINYIDSNGAFAWGIIAIVAACIAIVGLDHALAANLPDGSYALGSEQRENGVRVKGVYAEGNGFEMDTNGITVCDVEVGVVSCSVENDYATIEVVDCLTASATAEIDWSGSPSVDVSAVASIYSPRAEFTLPLGFINITIDGEAYIGGVGAGIELDTDTGKLKITPPFAGVGGSFGVDFDLVS